MDPMKELHRIAEFQRSLKHHSEALRREMIPSWVATAAEQERLLQNSMGVLYYRDHLAPIVNSFKDSVASLKIVESEHSRWTALNKESEHTRKQIEGLGSITLPSMLWESNLYRVLDVMSDVRLFQTLPGVSDRLLNPFNYYSEFARNTVRRIHESDDTTDAPALSASLFLAEEEISATAEFLSVTIDDAAEEAPLVDIPKLSLLEAQREDLLLVHSIPAHSTPDELRVLSESAQIAGIARKIAQAVVDCNRLARTAGRKEIFKPTTALLDALNQLPWIIADDQATFGSVVDHLYISIYEAAGKDNLRFSEFVEKEDSVPLWSLKHLRNKWLRHDPDHGDERKIEKDWGDLEKALGVFGAAAFPTETREFRSLQRQVLTQTLGFLEHLKEKLKAA